MIQADLDYPIDYGDRSRYRAIFADNFLDSQSCVPVHWVLHAMSDNRRLQSNHSLPRPQRLLDFMPYYKSLKID